MLTLTETTCLDKHLAMTEPADVPTTDERVRSDSDAPGGMPRWVKVSLIVVTALMALFVIANIAGIGGEHGPGRHGGGDETPSSMDGNDGGHRPPVDHGP